MAQTTASDRMGVNPKLENSLPVEASRDPFYSSSNLNALAASIDQMRQGRTVAKTLEELETMAGE